MKARCYAPSNANMGYYQKDNITVCDRWRNSFENFMEDMGSAPSSNHSIERINNSLGYSKDNCEWIPKNEQSKNRRNVQLHSYNGEIKTLKDWAKHLNMNYDTLRARIVKYGLTFDEAIQQDPYGKIKYIDGVGKTVKEWAEDYGISAGNVYDRLHKGWDLEKALKTPVNKVSKI